MTINAASVNAEIARVQQRIAELATQQSAESIDENEWIAVLRASRLAQRLTQKDVADRMGTTQSAVCSLERGAVEPRFRTLVRYGAAVGFRTNVTFEPLEDPGVAA